MDEIAGRRGGSPNLDLAAVVRQALSLLEGTGEDLAHEAGLPPRRLTRVRAGAARPTAAEVEALADALAGRAGGDPADRDRADLAERVLRMALEMGADEAG